MFGSWKSGRFIFFAAIVCAPAVSGCNSVPTSGIDPTGERFFAAPPTPVVADRSNELYYDQPLGELSWDDASVDLHPRETVAPVGSEVVLIAGVCGKDGYLRMNRRLEWSIDPGGVGQFVDVGKTGFVDLMLGDFNMPRKVTNTFAIGSTLRSNIRLNRGSCNPETNAYVLRGQGWISLTSAVEGSSNVTVFAPEVYRWDARLASGTIHWVDAEWQLPAPAINAAGSKHVFATTVTRLSNKTPCEGWRVRYEIVDGPPAGFSPDGSQSVEVPTDSAGRACAEIFQPEPRHGVNKVNIQVIRPGNLPGANGRRLVVGSGTTTKTWTGPDLAVKITGPQAGNPGATLSYQINVSNPGDLPAKDVVATMTVPNGLAYLQSNPAAETLGAQLQWRLGELGARQTRPIQLSLRADREGNMMNCCDAASAEGLKARECLTTTITTASLDVRIDGPPQVKVGDQATFVVTVTNLSQTPVTNLTIRDRFDPGLEHLKADPQSNSIERQLGSLAAGASQPIHVSVRVTRAGRLCQTVEISGPTVATATAQKCVEGIADTTATTPDVAPPSTPAAPTTPAVPATPTLSVKLSCPNRQLAVGEEAQFTLEIANTGSETLKNLTVLDLFDPEFDPVLATKYHRFEGDGLAWTIDELAPGKPVTLGLHCKCLKKAGRACNRVRVTTPEGGKVEEEFCLEITEPVSPPPTTPDATRPDVTTSDASIPNVITQTTLLGGLELWAVGLHNPVSAGKSVTYEVKLQNNGNQPFRQVVVTATVPEGMTPEPFDMVEPRDTQYRIDGRTIRFDPIAEIGAGKLLVYRIRIRANQPGREFRFHVEASAENLPQPLVQEVATEVL